MRDSNHFLILLRSFLLAFGAFVVCAFSLSRSLDLSPCVSVMVACFVRVRSGLAKLFLSSSRKNQDIDRKNNRTVGVSHVPE